MTTEVREISALIALVSTTLMGTTILLLRVAWHGLTNSYFKIRQIERREIGRMTWWISLSIVIIFSVATWIGIINPKLVPWSIILLILFIEIVALIYSFILWVINRIRKINKEQRSKKLDELSLFYSLSFSFLALSIFCNIFALLGISATMLNIQITPNWLDNYNLGRWLMLDGISLFCIGMPILGYASLKFNWQREFDSKK